jgi:hypothetical protein
MADIYSRARKVIIWLGLESHDSRRAMNLIKNPLHVSSLIEFCPKYDSKDPQTKGGWMMTWELTGLKGTC